MPDDRPLPPPDAVLVETGGFRVDRTRALEKLRDYQLPDAELFLLPWVRCAAALGASALRVDSDPDGIALRCDGIPFPRAAAEDPYAALFDEASPGTEPAAHFAVGLLGALRLKPRSITLASGKGPDRFRLTARSLEEDSVEPDESPGGDTVLRVNWQKPTLLGTDLAQAVGLRGSADARILEKLRAGCGMLKIPLTVNGEPSPALPEAATTPWIECARDGARAVLISAPSDDRKRVYFYKRGVRAGFVEHDLPLAMVAHVDDDAFRLNASHSGVLEDERRALALRLAKDHTGSLLARACEEQSRRASHAARTFLSVYGLGRRRLPDWVRLFGRAAGKVSEVGKEALGELEREAKVASWLRRTAASHLTDYEADRSHPALKALWETPLFLSVLGRPLSLLDLRRQLERIGWVPYSDPSIHYPDPWLLRFEPSVDIVWMLDYDQCLRRIFPKKLREWQAYHTFWELAKLPFRGLRKKRVDEPSA